MKWIEANGVSLRYELGGAGKDALLLIHEMGGALESWDEALPAFQQFFRTLRYDQRGFGYSEKAPGKLTMEDMVGDIVALLDGLNITMPCQVAASALGSGIAMAFAARYPSRVSRLAIASPVTGATAARRSLQEERAATIEREGMRSCEKESLNISYPQALRGNPPRFETFRLRWIANDPESYAAISRMLGAMDLVPELQNIACPTLVLGASQDTQRPPALARSIAEQIRGARFVEVDSGHFMAVQTPELFVRHVLPFLRGIA